MKQLPPSIPGSAEQALHESEDNFHTTFNHLAFGIAQTNLAGRHVQVNDRYCELTGYSRAELLNLTFLDITHPADRDRNQQQFHQLLVHESNHYELEKRYVHKDGKVVWVQVSVSFVEDEAGAPSYAIAGVQDISERKRKEETLRFLVDLNTAAQQLVDPQDIMAVTTRMLGKHLGANRCAYAEVESDEDHFVVMGDYVCNVQSIVGRYRMAAFGETVLQQMRAGEPFVVNDVDTDPQVGPDTSAYRATQIQAVVCVPLQKAGRFAACMAVHQEHARHWEAAEVELIQLVVARSWESIERARSVRDLRESEQRLQFVMDSLPQKIFTAAANGETEYVNPQWLSFTGLPFRDIKYGQTKLIHPDDLADNMKAWQHSLQTGEPMQYEHRFLRSDGQYRWHVTHAAPIFDAQGKISMWVGSNTDIHDMKLAEAAATKRSEQVHRLATMASQLNTTSDVPSILAIVAEEARHLLAANFCAMAFDNGHGSENLSSCSRKEGWHVEPAKVLAATALLCERVRTTNQPKRLTAAELKAQVNSATGAIHDELPGDWMAAPLVAKDGTNLGTIQLLGEPLSRLSEDDLAVLVQLAQMTSVALENARLMAGLREANLRKDEFLATLAHELRNPLAPIRNMLALIKATDSNMELRTQAHLTMERQLAHMVRLIDDLLDVSRLSRGKLELRMEQVELSELMHQTVEVFQPLFDAHGHTLIVVLPPQPIYLTGDATRLIQAFGNLLDNACKYSRPNGEIRFGVECAEQRILISVKDNGIGIPADKIDVIFDMFAQVDRSLERPVAGLGIGLTLTKRFIEMHQGTIAAHSAGLEQGSEFIVHLPLPEEPQMPKQPPREIFELPDYAKRRVLVVDDNRDAAVSLALLLKHNGDDTATAHDGLEALQAAEHFRPNVILLDIGMPKLNGYEVCRRIREQPWGKNVLIIAVSGWGQERDRQQSQESGFDHHLVKPVDFNSLIALLAHQPKES